MSRDRLLDLMYDAAVEPAEWQRFLSKLCAEAGAAAAAINIHDNDREQYSLPVNVGIDGKMLQTYADYYGAKDELFVQAIEKGLPKTGLVELSQDFCDYARFERSEAYTDWFRPADLYHQCGAVIYMEKDRTVLLTAVRSKGAGAFEEEHRRLLQGLTPHLQRATRIHYVVTELRAQRQALESAVESSSTAMLLVGRNAKVLFANREARRLLAEADGPRTVDGRLWVPESAQRQRLRAAVEGAAKTGSGGHGSAGGAFVLRRGVERSPLYVTVSPFRLPPGTLNALDAVAAVFITDPERRREVQIAALRSLFSLTEAEARLAQALAAGATVKEYAAGQGISLNTANTQLKSIFDKTGTRRQAELMRLLVQIETHPILP